MKSNKDMISQDISATMSSPINTNQLSPGKSTSITTSEPTNNYSTIEIPLNPSQLPSTNTSTRSTLSRSPGTMPRSTYPTSNVMNASGTAASTMNALAQGASGDSRKRSLVTLYEMQDDENSTCTCELCHGSGNGSKNGFR